MSTRSAFGTIVNGVFKGRYIHSDGYPAGVGADLATLIQRDGVDRVLDVMTKEHYGWSSLMPALPEQPQLTTAEMKRLGEDYKNPAHRWAWFQPGQIYGDGRFAGVPGYGIAYTTDQGQSKPDEFVTFTVNASEDAWGTEWAYAIDNSTSGANFVVIRIGRGSVHKVVATIPLTELNAGELIDRIGQDEDKDHSG